MTLQQEIVEALRNTAGCFVMIGEEFLGEKTLRAYADKIKNIAAKVEAARCETCKRYFVVTSKDMEGIPCPWAGSGGCWNYAPEEKVNL